MSPKRFALIVDILFWLNVIGLVGVFCFVFMNW